MTAIIDCISNRVAATGDIDFYAIKSLTTICKLDFGHLLEWFRLPGELGPPPGTGAASRDWGRPPGLGPPSGAGAARGDWGRLRGLAPPPGTSAASGD